MDDARGASRIGSQSTRSGLSDRMGGAKKVTRTKGATRTSRAPRDGVVTTSKAADELLAKAREAGASVDGPDESTLSTIESLLRDV
ncbi:MAG: hypothetical protein JST73_13550 [Actinobacteria bacterium]|nr:hypothetical protein [Actinomycetota bacterium]